MIKKSCALSEFYKSGSTLIEVLMSILIMSIGVVSIMTLFPLAVLRSLHATQLTQGTILRYNAEEIIDHSPIFLHLPGNSTDYLDYVNENYVVDPYGWANLRIGASGLEDNFGNDLGAVNTDIIRYKSEQYFADLGFSGAADPSTDLAYEHVGTKDNWNEIISGYPTSSTLSSVTFPAGTDFTGSLVASENGRIVLFDVDGKHSEWRKITSIAGDTVNWTKALPVSFEVGKAKIERVENTYSWMITVNKDLVGVARVSLVVFFRRSFNPQDENIYTLTQVSPNVYDEYQVNWGAPYDPKIDKGGYVFDHNNCRWYQILSVERSAGSAILKLDIPNEMIEKEETFSKGIFLPGIVRVYSLGSK